MIFFGRNRNEHHSELDSVSFDEACERARVLRREDGADDDGQQRDFLMYNDTKVATASLVYKGGQSLFPSGALPEADTDPTQDPDFSLTLDITLGRSVFSSASPDSDPAPTRARRTLNMGLGQSDDLEQHHLELALAASRSTFDEDEINRASAENAADDAAAAQAGGEYNVVN